MFSCTKKISRRNFTYGGAVLLLGLATGMSRRVALAMGVLRNQKDLPEMTMSLGHSTCLFAPEVPFCPDNLELFSRFGYQDIEISEWHLNQARDIFTKSEKLGLRINSIHSSGGDLSDLDNTAVTRIRGIIKDQIKLAAEATHGQIVVLHGSYPFKDEQLRKSKRIILIETLKQLIDTASKYNVRLALETLIPYPHMLGDSALEILGVLEDVDGGKHLGVCMDVGHVACCEKPLPACRLLAPKVITTHIHDNNGTHGLYPLDRGPDFTHGDEDRHLIPGDGGLDFSGIYQILVESDYKGPWMYEVTTIDPQQLTKQPEAVLKRIATYHKHHMPQFVRNSL